MFSGLTEFHNFFRFLATVLKKFTNGQVQPMSTWERLVDADLSTEYVTFIIEHRLRTSMKQHVFAH